MCSTLISKGLMKIILSALDSFEMLHRTALIGALTHNGDDMCLSYIEANFLEFSRLSNEMISTRFWVSKFSAESD